MPELVSNGPRIPVHLMNEVDTGSVVFFCGAGVSRGDGSGLPDFAELVEHVYETNRMEPDEVEREALHRDEPNADLWRPQFDKALGLLERPERLGAPVLRRTVIDCLSTPPTAPLRVHEALIALSRTEKGVRLVTTNFDQRFVEAGLGERYVDSAPMLAVPKRHSWSSLVHLHGRIVPGDDGSNLVLTAADFGRAYLTERWAARFVTELFREFTVIFVGYGVADPVMGYLVDALAAERDKGARFANAFAFAPHDGTPVGQDKARDSWLAKNVKPILYDRRDGHRLLGETLTEWARIRCDYFQARSRIALNEIRKLPAGSDDPAVERVVWALDDPEASRALAEAPPILDEDDFPKIESWLEAFQQEGLLRCAADKANPGTGDLDPGFVRLVDGGFHVHNPQGLDLTRAYLARWIARHLHVPQVLAWLLRTGGHMHPRLRDMVRMKLIEANSDIPPRLRLLWTILSNSEPRDPHGFLWSPEHYQAADSDTERRRIEDAAIATMAPRLVVVPGPASRLRFAQYFDGETGPISPIDACGHPRLAVGDEDSWFQLEGILERPEVLFRHAVTLTGHLELALRLAEEDGEVYPDSSLYRPSIAAHDQNRYHGNEGLGRLIDLVRDSYLELAGRDRARADNLVRRWVLSGRPLFRRLALHALTENSKSDIRLAEKLLVSGRRPGVWGWELQREVLRFLRLAGSRVPRGLRVEIVRAIHAGPKPKPRNPPPNYALWIRREQALRLHKLAVSGARLDKRSREFAAELEPGQDADGEWGEFARRQVKPRWIGDEEFAPRDLLDGTAADVAAAIKDEGIDADQFRGLARLQPGKAAEALEQLGDEGRWPAEFWQHFLWSMPYSSEGEGVDSGLQQRVAGLLVRAPDELFEEIDATAADFVMGLAKEYGAEREQEIEILWARAWRAVGRRRPAAIGVLEEPLTDALNDPAGRLADAAMNRLSKHGPGVGDNLPAPVRPYFEAIAGEPNGHLGRVMLATRLHYLFAVDPDWVGERLIPLFSAGQSQEAGNLWYAYGWSQTIGPDLLLALKDSFLAVFREGEINARTEHNLTLLFLVICLEAPNELTDDEVHGVVGAMSEDGLETVLAGLRDRLKSDAAERAQIWSQKLQPWLEKYWPLPAARNTPGTSKAIVEVLADCGDAFPEATAWALKHLQPIEGGLFRLRQSGQAGRYPEATLEILAKVVGPNGISPQHRHTLREILDEMREAMPGVEDDRRMHRLYGFAAQ